MPERVSLEPSILRLGARPAQDVLLGSQCTVCERYHFPPRQWCGQCAQPTTKPVQYGRTGILTSFSVMTRKPDYAIVDVPYVLGEVTLAEGVIVYSLVTGVDAARLRPGQAVELVTITIRQDATGNVVCAYAFAPVG